MTHKKSNKNHAQIGQVSVSFDDQNRVKITRFSVDFTPKGTKMGKMSAKNGSFSIANGLRTAELWQFLRELAPGNHEVQCSEETKNRLKAIAWDYSEAYPGHKVIDKKTHVIRVLTSLQNGFATVMMTDHKWREDLINVFSPKAVVEAAKASIAGGLDYVVECTRSQLGSIRVAAYKAGGLQVVAIPNGCVIRRPDGQKTKRQIYEDRVRDVAAGKDVRIRCDIADLMSARSMLSMAARIQGVVIQTHYKDGYLVVTKKASKEARIVEEITRKIEAAGVDLDTVVRMLKGSK